MITELLVKDIFPNPDQPRKTFDEESIKELADSIVADGLQQPIIVRPKNGQYEIVQGERRWRAHKIVGLETIRAEIKEMHDEQAFHLAVIENIQREQLTPIEEAQAFMKYVEMGYTHDQIAKKVNKRRDYVSGRLRLLKLIPSLADWIAKEKISEGHAKQILKLEEFVNRLCGDRYRSIHGMESHFEAFQHKFFAAFCNAEKITVNDVSEWVDGCKHGLIQTSIFKYLGVYTYYGNTVLGDQDSADRECQIYDLDISRVTEDDLDFMAEYEKEKMKGQFNREIRPWHIDKFYDELRDKLFYAPKTSKDLPDDVKETLDEAEKGIRQHASMLAESIVKMGQLYKQCISKFGEEVFEELLKTTFNLSREAANLCIYISDNRENLSNMDIVNMIGDYVDEFFPIVSRDTPNDRQN